MPYNPNEPVRSRAVDSLWVAIQADFGSGKYCGYPDHDLLAIFQKSDSLDRADAFEVLYNRHGKSLLAFLFYQLDGNRDDILDVFGEVWKVAFEQADHITWSETAGIANPFSAWLFECARRRVKACYQRRTAQRNLVDLSAAYDLRDPCAPSLVARFEDSIIARLQDEGDVTNSGPGIEESLLFKDIIQDLRPVEQELLKWKFNTNMTNAQIAQQLGRTIGAIKTATSRAVDKVKKILEERQRARGKSQHA